MKNSNAHRVVIMGTLLLLAVCVIWLSISRQTVDVLQRDMEQVRLRNESLLSENLLLEKTIDKESRKYEKIDQHSRSLQESLDNRKSQLKQLESERSKSENLLQTAAHREKDLREQLFRLRAELKGAQQVYALMRTRNEMKSDSIKILLMTLDLIQHDLDQAITRSIDQTLLVARRGNGKLTSKARKVRELIARVDLPAKLDDLSFELSAPDGKIISDDGTLTVRPVAFPAEMTASIAPFSFPGVRYKTMQILYQPDDKFENGRYTLKIYNGLDYVGSMNVSFGKMN